MKKLFILLFLLMTVNVAQATWWDTNYSYYKPITINHEYVNGTVVNHTLLINITDTDLRDKAQSDGDDIVFITSDNTTQLDHQIESLYNSTTGHLIAWIRIPSISNTSDTIMNMYYNYSAATNSENPSGTWGVNASGVWLMDEGNGLWANDSSSNTNNGSLENMADPPNSTSGWNSSGKVDGCLQFDGNNDSVDCGNAALLRHPVNHTYIIRFKVGVNISGSSNLQSILNIDSRSDIIIRTSGELSYEYYNGSYHYVDVGQTTWSLYDWYTVVAVKNSAIGHKIYLNGQLKNSDAITDVEVFNAARGTGIGARTWSDPSVEFFDGSIDQVCIYDRVWSIQEIATLHNNTDNSTSFSTVGLEQSQPVGGTPDPINLSYTRGNTWVHWTWDAGSGNVTDLWNRSINGSWDNSSANDYYNHTGLQSGNYSEIIVYAWNSTYGELSSGYVTDNVSTTGVAPIITSYAPTVTIWPEVADSQRFNVTVDQSTQCRWYINGSLVQTNATPSLTHAYTNISLNGGGCNVTAVVNNTNGTDSQTWIFEVGADSVTWIVLKDQPTNQTMIAEWNVTRIGSNITDWGWWQNHTYNGWQYFFRFTNGTEIMNTTATSDNESLWFNGTSLLPIGVYYIDATSMGAPNITSWSNNKTNNNSLDITINVSEIVNFNATANQTITTWGWYKDDADQSHNFDNITLSWGASGSKTVKVNATNPNGTSSTITWNVTVSAVGAPVVTLLSQTPSIILQNTTGYLNISYGISHDSSGLNNTSVSFIFRNYDHTLNDANHSIRPPANDMCDVWNYNGRIIRAANRNETLNFEDNDTITGGDTHTWSGLDENNTRLTIIPVNSTYTIVHINGTTHGLAMEQMWYLDRTDMIDAPKTQLAIHKSQDVLIKFWDAEIFKGNYNFVGAGYTDTSLKSAPASHPSDANPVSFYYLNSSYNPLGGVDPPDSAYAVYMGSLNATQWVDYIYSPDQNASYIRGLINNSLLNSVIDTTEISYLYFKSNTPSSKPFYINITDASTGTNRTFGQTDVLWIGNSAPYTAHPYTPNVWFAFIYDNTSFDHKLYVADNNGNWGNGTLQSTNIGAGLFPPTTPSINHFHFNGSDDYDINKTYSGTIEVHVGVGTDPDGGTVTHNLTLHYANQTLVAIINNTFTDADIIGNGVYADISFNTTPYYSETEEYTLKVVATDDEGATSESWSCCNFTLGTHQISNLHTTTLVYNRIVWGWVNPDYYDTIMVYLDNAWKQNTTGTSYSASSLSQTTAYTIKLITVYAGEESDPVTDTQVTPAEQGGGGGGGGTTYPPEIDDTTDTLTFDQPSYQLGDTVTMYATGTNIGDATWYGTISFTITQPDGEIYTILQSDLINVAPDHSKTVEESFVLPATGHTGLWTAQSKWISSDKILSAQSSILALGESEEKLTTNVTENTTIAIEILPDITKDTVINETVHATVWHLSFDKHAVYVPGYTNIISCNAIPPYSCRYYEDQKKFEVVIDGESPNPVFTADQWVTFITKDGERISQRISTKVYNPLCHLTFTPISGSVSGIMSYFLYGDEHSVSGVRAWWLGLLGIGLIAWAWRRKK